MYVRFVVPAMDCDSGCRAGIFQAINELKNCGDLRPYEKDHMREVLDWFNENLETPTSLVRSRYHGPHIKAICWFKDSARDHIARMWEIVAVLEQHDIAVSLIKTRRPGYVSYEDRYQIAAEPHVRIRF
jgi:hypothetical protein